MKELAEALKKSIEDSTDNKIEINVVLFDDDGFLKTGNYDVALTFWGKGDTPNEIIMNIPGLSLARFTGQDTVLNFLQSGEKAPFMEAELLKEAMVIPLTTNERCYMLTRMLPYTLSSDGKLKTARVQEDPVRTSQRKKSEK